MRRYCEPIDGRAIWRGLSESQPQTQYNSSKLLRRGDWIDRGRVPYSRPRPGPLQVKVSKPAPLSVFGSSAQSGALNVSLSLLFS